MSASNASGESFPGLFIFGGNSVPPAILQAPRDELPLSSMVDPETHQPREPFFFANKSGGMVRETAAMWFDAVIKPCLDSGVAPFILCDGHASHAAYPFLEKVSAAGGIVVLLPPHTTHRTQREDIAIFQTFKSLFARAKMELSRSMWLSGQQGLTVSKHWLATIKTAWDIAHVHINILRGWSKSGVSPFTQLPLWLARELFAERTARARAILPQSGTLLYDSIVY